MSLIVCGADEVKQLVSEKEIGAVLSIEHPGATDGKGRAPRLAGIAQKILCFWDTEEVDFPEGPSEDNIREAMDFLDQYSGQDVIVHCKAGKARSAGIALAWQARETDIISAVEWMKAMRPQAGPNLAVIQIADRLFNMEGALEQAVLDDPLFTENREKTNIRRLQQINDPEILKNIAPEKLAGLKLDQS